MNRSELRASRALSPKKHHYLVAGQISYQVNDDIVGMNLNAILTTDIQQVTGRDLGKAQQALQLHFRKRSNSDVEIVDVFIHSISYLGLMTEVEFAPPEKAKPVVKDNE